MNKVTVNGISSLLGFGPLKLGPRPLLALRQSLRRVQHAVIVSLQNPQCFLSPCLFRLFLLFSSCVLYSLSLYLFMFTSLSQFSASKKMSPCCFNVQPTVCLCLFISLSVLMCLRHESVSLPVPLACQCQRFVVFICISLSMCNMDPLCLLMS